MIAFDAPIPFDSPDYTFDGAPVTPSVAVPRVRYQETTRPRFREQRHPVYQEGIQ